MFEASRFGFSQQKMLRWIEDHGECPILTVDSHTAGNPTRIILGGVEVPAGVRGVHATREWLRTNRDEVRTRLVHEPRGGALTCAVLPVEATGPDHDIGAVILEPGSYPPMCGHCMIGFAGVLAELGLVQGETVSADTRRLRIATPAGIVAATVQLGGESGISVELTNVPSYFVDSWRQTIDGVEVPVEVVYGGDYYPTVDAGLLGVSLTRDSASKIVDIAAQIRDQAAVRTVNDRLSSQPLDIYQVMFFERLSGAEPAVRSVVVAPPGVIDRSPCGTGSSALYALLVHRGEHDPSTPLRTVSIIGSRFEISAARVEDRERRPVVTPVLRGSAHLTGFSWTVTDPLDDLGDGFPPL